MAVGTAIFVIFTLIGVVLLTIRQKCAAKELAVKETPFQKPGLDTKQIISVNYVHKAADIHGVAKSQVHEKVREILSSNEGRVGLPVEERIEPMMGKKGGRNSSMNLQ